MAIDLFHCPICHRRYDDDLQAPKILAKCGSTICLECLTKLLKKNKGSPACPLHPENKEPLLWTEVEKFASNLLILQQLPESNPKILSCPQHKSKLKFVCIQDKTFLCKYCIQSKDHKAHPVYHVNDIKGLAIAKKQQLETIVSNLAPSAQQTTLMKNVIEKFDLLKKFVALQQTELLAEASKQFFQAKPKLKLEKEKIEDQINNQINDLSEKELNPNFFEALKEDIAFSFPLESQAEQFLGLDTQIAKINELRKNIHKALAVFEPLRIEEHKTETYQKEKPDKSSPKVEEKSFLFPHPTQKGLNIKIEYNNIYTTLTPLLEIFKSLLPISNV